MKIAAGVITIIIIKTIDRIAEIAFPAELIFKFVEFLKLERANTKNPYINARKNVLKNNLSLTFLTIF